MADFYTQAMFGQHAVHVPMWMKVQDMGPNGVLFVGASRSDELRYKSDKTHQLILGEIIVRPHLVIGSNEFRGYGVGGLVTECNIDKWVSKGDIILDLMDKLKTKDKE